jgi:NADPH:quinone reductase-like Zn-dependent oxidoreductase
VLVAVGACAVNATDINTRVGWYAKGEDDGAWDAPIGFPRIQGADACGRIAAVGAGVDEGRIGARVLVDPWLRDADAPDDLDRCGYVGSERDGGYAEYLVVPDANARAITSARTDAELASFVTSYATALNRLRRAGVAAGDVVLVTGASGGVGTALVQLVGILGGVPIAVCGADKADAVRAVGARAVLARDADLRVGVRAATGRETVDLVADVVGGDRWPELIALIRRGGRYTVSGAIGGPIVPLDLRTLYLADLTFTGVAVQPPGLFDELVRLVEAGSLRPVVAATYPLEAVGEAQAAFERKEHVGKIVLTI